MCTCRLSIRYLSWENMQIWNLRSQRSWRLVNLLSLQHLRRLETRVKLFFFANTRLLLPKKSSQLEMYLILLNFLNLMYVRSVIQCACFPWIYIVCAFVASHVFMTVRCYRRVVQKSVVPWIVFVFGPLVRITNDYPSSVEHFNFRIVEFRSVEMLSHSRMRDVSNSNLNLNFNIPWKHLWRITRSFKCGFIVHNQQLTPEVDGRVIKLLDCVANFDCQPTYLRIFSNQNISNKIVIRSLYGNEDPTLFRGFFISFCLKKVPWLLVMCLSEFRKGSCEKTFLSLPTRQIRRTYVNIFF